jgi:hypothetical protein
MSSRFIKFGLNSHKQAMNNFSCLIIVNKKSQNRLQEFYTKMILFTFSELPIGSKQNYAKCAVPVLIKQEIKV